MGWGENLNSHFPEFLLKCQLVNCIVSDEISTCTEKISTCFWAVCSLTELWLFLCICLCFSCPSPVLFVSLPSVLADIFFFSLHSCSRSTEITTIKSAQTALRCFLPRWTNWGWDLCCSQSSFLGLTKLTSFPALLLESYLCSVQGTSFSVLS